MTLKISGMGCMHCVAKVTAALKELGADVKKVEIGS
ncbi:MAG: heavy-metal-associated domain-containing protein, partial [Clostridia bacterium]|nr:heavy-metal-associated domain-containing protein [Clostridia bacterium]